MVATGTRTRTGVQRLNGPKVGLGGVTRAASPPTFRAMPYTIFPTLRVALPQVAMPLVARDGLLIAAAVSCLVAQYFILRAVWRVVPAETGSPSVPAPRRASEMAWALLPAVLIVAVFVGAWRTMHPSVMKAVPASATATSVTATSLTATSVTMR